MLWVKQKIQRDWNKMSEIAGRRYGIHHDEVMGIFCLYT